MTKNTRNKYKLESNFQRHIYVRETRILDLYYYPFSITLLFCSMCVFRFYPTLAILPLVYYTAQVIEKSGQFRKTVSKITCTENPAHLTYRNLNAIIQTLQSHI